MPRPTPRPELALALLIMAAAAAVAQTPAPAAGVCQVKPVQGAKAEGPPGAAGGVRIVATGPDGKPLRRKRFYLLSRSARAAAADWSGVPRREEFLKGASPELRAWLARHDCDTLYCPEYEVEYERAARDVPEFRKALDDGLRKYRSRELALRWLTVNFPLKDARAEYYRRKRAWLEEAARRAGAVGSVMTDEKGAAFFLGVKPGPYFVSNLLPPGDGGVLWDCALDVPPPVPKQLHSISLDLSHVKKQ
jgi:hypothetical protein